MKWIQEFVGQRMMLIAVTAVVGLFSACESEQSESIGIDGTELGPIDADRPLTAEQFSEIIPSNLPVEANSYIAISDFGLVSAAFDFTIRPSGDDFQVVLSVDGIVPNSPLPVALTLTMTSDEWATFLVGQSMLDGRSVQPRIAYPLTGVSGGRTTTDIRRNVDVDAPWMQLTLGLTQFDVINDDSSVTQLEEAEPTAWVAIHGVPTITCESYAVSDEGPRGQDGEANGHILVGDPNFRSGFCRTTLQTAGLEAYVAR